MPRLGVHLVYLVLLPVIVSAAATVGYFSWRNASRLAQLNQQTIGQSTLVAVRQKVDVLETEIIEADNRVFALVDPSDPKTIEETWPGQAREISPSVRAVAVLDDELRRIALVVRGSDEDKWKFWRVLKQRLVPKLDLGALSVGKLKHLHELVDGTPYLISCETFEQGSNRFYVMLHHDSGYLVRETFPALLTQDEGNRVYNVSDELNGTRIFGPSLDNSGVFVGAPLSHDPLPLATSGRARTGAAARGTKPFTPNQRRRTHWRFLRHHGARHRGHRVRRRPRAPL